MSELRKTFEDFENDGQVGDWCFVGDENHLSMWLRYPCSEDSRGGFVRLPVINKDLPAQCWQWDGNREAPTLSPSILINGGDGKGGRKEKWHGFLRAGKLETV